MMMKKTAAIHVMMASVSSQPEISCHAGSVKRKKFSGLPKIGSTTLPVARGAYQKSASVGHSDIMPAPVTRAMISDPTKASKRNAGSAGRLTGCPPKKIVWLLGKAGRCARFRAANDAYRTKKVAAAKSAKMLH